MNVNASPPRPWARRLVAVVIVVGVLALAVILRAVWAGGSAEPQPLPTVLAVRLATALEQATPADHQGHGHDLTGTAEVYCAVEVFGFEPAEATAPEHVRTVYALHLCAVSEDGRPWDFATKTAGPLVATWGEPPSVQLVRSNGGDYTERVRQAIPARYHDRALGSFADGRAVAELRARFDASVARFWAARKASSAPAG